LWQDANTESANLRCRLGHVELYCKRCLAAMVVGGCHILTLLRVCSADEMLDPRVRVKGHNDIMLEIGPEAHGVSSSVATLLGYELSVLP
jgi:hypothetical protein